LTSAQQTLTIVAYHGSTSLYYTIHYSTMAPLHST